MFTGNRALLRNVLISTVAVAGILYELLKASPPRWEVIAGYGIVIAFAIFRLTTRSINQDQREASNHT